MALGTLIGLGRRENSDVPVPSLGCVACSSDPCVWLLCLLVHIARSSKRRKRLLAYIQYCEISRRVCRRESNTRDDFAATRGLREFSSLATCSRQVNNTWTEGSHRSHNVFLDLRDSKIELIATTASLQILRSVAESAENWLGS